MQAATWSPARWNFPGEPVASATGRQATTAPPMFRSRWTRMSSERPQSFGFSGPPGATALVLAGVFAASGCASRGNTELLEANLREHQDRLSAYEKQVGNLGMNGVRRAEADQLRRELIAIGKDGTPENTEPLARVASLQFNSMMTGARDADGAPGHDVITAVLAPIDKDGDLVKLGGELEVEVLDLTKSGDAQRVGQWKYSAQQARDLWHSGFLASGFQLDLRSGRFRSRAK